MLLWIEFALVLISIVLAFCFPQVRSNWFRTAEQQFAALARHRRLACLVVGIAALGARAAVLPLLPVPQPRTDDEFSHLLLADTLAHGRLANPTHPMWIHFEMFHVLMRPTYASMYPPGQGIALAVGQIIARQPFVGVWLSAAAMCAAICWMLQGWLPAEWALLGGAIAIMRFCVFSYWADSYWGGAVAATGGALVLGALPRILRSPRSGDALLMGLGLAILANSRPYEGFILSLPVAAALLIWLSKMKGPQFWATVRSILAPLILVIIFAVTATGYYYWKVTGSPFRMPQQVERDTYAVAPYFVWQSPRPEPVYRHDALRDFYLHDEMVSYDAYRQRTHTVGGLFVASVIRIVYVWIFFLGPVLTLPLLMAIAALPYGLSWAGMNWQTRFLLLASAVSIAGIGIEVFFFPHYAAPMTGLIYLVIFSAMRSAWVWKWHSKPVGRRLMTAVPIICLLMIMLRAGAAPLHLPLSPVWPPTWYNLQPIVTDRAYVQALLNGYSGKHLVMARYDRNSPVHYQRLFNEAEIDRAKIVWAWDMGPAQNQELIDYFKDRHVWLIEPALDKPKLIPYSVILGQTGE